MKKLVFALIALGCLSSSAFALPNLQYVTQGVSSGVVSGTYSYLTGSATPANRIYIRERTGTVDVRISFKGNNPGTAYITAPANMGWFALDINPAVTNSGNVGIFISTSSTVAPGSDIEYLAEILKGL